MKSASYVKIALFFVVLGGAGIGYTVLSTGGINPLTTTTFEAVLADASGISSRSIVYLAGVPVGQVQNIQLYGNAARVRFAILNDVPLRQDAYITRLPSSILGTSVLSLNPGTELTPILAPGGIIGTAPTMGDLGAVMVAAQDIGGQVSLILEEFRTNQMALLAVSLETFNSIAQRIDAQSEDQLYRVARILESAALIAERTDRMLQASEGNITGSFSDLHESLLNIRTITGEIVAGRGTLGQVFFDDRLHQSVLTTAERTEELAVQLGEAIDDISALVRNVDGVVTNAGEIVERAVGLGIQVDTNARYEFLSGNARAAASLRLEPLSRDRWYRVGVTSTPDGVSRRTVTETTHTGGDQHGQVIREDTTQTRHTVAIDAELARKFGPLTIRGGILESTAGFGMDFQALDRMSVSGELFRFTGGEGPNLRSAITFYPFFNPDSNMPWNWIYLRAGVTDALSGNRDYFIGGGLRFADREVRGLIGLAPIFN